MFAVITQADVPDVRYGLFVKDRTLFAKDVVRWEGEVVAAVAASTPQIAQRALDLIEIEYEPLPVVRDLEAALDPATQLVHETWREYAVDERVERGGNEASRSSIVRGDAAAAMAGADVVVTGRFVADGSQAVPDRAPRARRRMARRSGADLVVDTGAVRGACARVGDAGAAGERRPDHRASPGWRIRGQVRGPLRTAGGSAREGRPPAREGGLHATRGVPGTRPSPRGHGHRARDRCHGRRHGRARRGKLITENGAYSADEPLITQMALQFLAGPYRLPNVDIVGHCVYTNTQPSGSVRAPGAPQAAWALEQHMDELAAALGMDAVELRRKNLLRDGDDAPLGQFMDSIHAIETLDRAAELIG